MRRNAQGQGIGIQKYDDARCIFLPGDARILVGSGVSKVRNLAGLAADEAVKVGALKSFARGVDEVALRALDLENLKAPE